MNKQNKAKLTIQDVAKHITKEYPDSNLQYYVRDYFLEDYDEDSLIEECNEFFRYKVLNICGCGSPEIAEKEIRDYLDILNEYTEAGYTDNAYIRKEKRLKERFNAESLYDNPLLLFMAYILDDKGFLEHGSCIGGAWITELGKMYLCVLNAMKLDNEET